MSGLSGCVHIRQSNDFPVQRYSGKPSCLYDGGPVKQPDRDIAGLAVPPRQIDMMITVKVGGRADLRLLCRNRASAGDHSIPGGPRHLIMAPNWRPVRSSYLFRRSVEIRNSLKPDLVLLGGDYMCGFGEGAFELGPILAFPSGSTVRPK
jgi:hypothetical protein